MNVYCIYASSYKCAVITQQLNTGVILPGVHAVQPQITQRKWVHGKPTEELHEYLPGYIFLYTEEEEVDFRTLFRVNGILRILGNRDDGYRLTGADLAFAKGLLEKEGVIGTVKTYAVGDRIHLADEIFRGANGQILKVDKGRQRLKVRFSFDEKEWDIWVGYDMVENPRVE